MSTLFGNNISQTYQGLIKLADSTTGVTSTTQSFQDGLGNNIPIQVSNTTVNISGSFLVNGQPVSIETGSFATTGSNTFIGNQTITGSVLISGSAPFDLVVTGSARLVSQDALSQLTMSPSSFNVNSTKTISGGAEGYIFGSTGSNAQFYLGVYDEPNFTTDVELNIKVDSNGISFKDWDNVTSGAYIPFMNIAPNLGDNPTPQFTRGLGVTGSIDITGQYLVNGVAFSSGTSGTSGINGTSGSDGTSGTSGSSGVSNSFFNYQAKTTITSGDPGSGHIIWDNATQTGSTQINVSDIDQQTNNLDVFLSQLKSGSRITLQDKTIQGNYQVWDIGTSTDNTVYWSFPVTLVSATHQFSNNDDILFIITTTPSGTSGTSGTAGTSGTSPADLDRVGLITTGSITDTQQITGSLILDNTILSGSLIGNTVNGGLIKIQNEANRSGSVQFNITGSSPISQSNVIFGNPAGAAIATQTGSVVISGSNNIILQGYRTNTIPTQGTYGYIGGNGNIGNIIPTLGTGSLLRPTMSQNALQAAVFLQFTTSSVGVQPSINSNLIYSAININSQSGSVNYGNNYNVGGVTLNQNTQNLTGSQSSINNNTFGGGITLNAISSSIFASSNITFGTSTIVTSSYFHTGSANSVTVNQNLIGGTNNHIQFGGNPATNVGRTFGQNILGGAGNVVNLNATGSDASYFNGIIFGSNLSVNPKEQIVGQAVFGRWNSTITGNTSVFVVGNGDSGISRRNAIEVLSNGNTNFTGSVNISGSLTTTTGITIDNQLSISNGKNSILENIAIGSGSLVSNTTGDHNIGIGERTLRFLTTGSANTAINTSLTQLVNGYNNTSVGYLSNGNLESGSNNTAIGGALISPFTGSNNTAIGFGAGGVGVGGVLDGGVYLGHRAGGGTTGSNLLVIDNQLRAGNDEAVTSSLIVGTFDADPNNQTLRINAATTLNGNTNITGSIDITGQYLVNGVPFTGGSSGTSGTDGSSGTSGDSLFALTGSVWSTTNNLQITGSLFVSSSQAHDVVINGQLYVSSSSTNAANAPKIIVSGSGGNTTINRNSVTVTTPTTVASLNPLVTFISSVATLDEIGYVIDPVTAGISGWTKGAAIYTNDPTDSYPAMIGFQDKANYTNGTVTVLRDLDVTGSIDITGQYLVNGVPVGSGDRNGLINTGSISTTQSITGSLIVSGAISNNNLIISGSQKWVYNDNINGNYGYGEIRGGLFELGNYNQVGEIRLGGNSDSKITLQYGGVSNKTSTIRYLKSGVAFEEGTYIGTDNFGDGYANYLYVSASINSGVGNYMGFGAQRGGRSLGNYVFSNSDGSATSVYISGSLSAIGNVSIGANQSNNHNFTGSVDITGSLSLNGTPITAGGGGGITQITGVTFLSSSWSLSSSLYIYDYSNSGITTSSFVMVIPSNSSINTVTAAQILPTTDSSSGSVRLYASYLPTANISGTINIQTIS